MSSKNNGTSDPLDFIAPIMVYYLNSVRQFQYEIQEFSSLGQCCGMDENETQNKFSLENLKAFIGVAPDLDQIKKGIKRMEAKEAIIYKILLDILGSYLRLFYGTNSKLYTKQYLPTAIEFYNRVQVH